MKFEFEVEFGIDTNGICIANETYYIVADSQSDAICSGRNLVEAQYRPRATCIRMVSCVALHWERFALWEAVKEIEYEQRLANAIRVHS